MSELTEWQQQERRRMAKDLIEQSNLNREKWEQWFPDSLSEVEVPRVYLFAMQHFAEIGLAAEKVIENLIDFSRPLENINEDESNNARREAIRLLERMKTNGQ